MFAVFFGTCWLRFSFPRWFQDFHWVLFGSRPRFICAIMACGKERNAFQGTPRDIGIRYKISYSRVLGCDLIFMHAHPYRLCTIFLAKSDSCKILPQEVFSGGTQDRSMQRFLTNSPSWHHVKASSAQTCGQTSSERGHVFLCLWALLYLQSPVIVYRSARLQKMRPMPKEHLVCVHFSTNPSAAVNATELWQKQPSIWWNQHTTAVNLSTCQFGVTCASHPGVAHSGRMIIGVARLRAREISDATLDAPAHQWQHILGPSGEYWQDFPLLRA